MYKYLVAFLATLSCFFAVSSFSASAYTPNFYVYNDSLPSYFSYSYMEEADLYNSEVTPYYVDLFSYQGGAYWVYRVYLQSNSPVSMDEWYLPFVYTDSSDFVPYRYYLFVSYDNVNWSRNIYQSDFNTNSDKSIFNTDYPGDVGVCYSTVPFTYNGKLYDPKPVDPDAPFTVTVTPELYEGMSPNIISFPSRGDGQTITATNYAFNFQVDLDELFVYNFGSSTLQEYGYSYTVFVVPSEFVSDDIDSMASHSVYNYVYEGYFTHDETEVQHGINVGMTPITESSKDWRVGYGWTNIRLVTCSKPSDTFVIQGDNIDFSKYPSDSYNFVIHAYQSRADKRIGNIPSTWYFQNTMQHLFKEKTSTTFGEINPVTYEYYKQYTWISDKFSYTEIPEFAPSDYDQSLDDGMTAQTNPFDFKRLPSKVWDDEGLFSSDENGNPKGTKADGYTPEEWENVVDNRKWTDNFSSDYGVGSFTDIFKGSSNVFKFITASLSVLPSWFMTILTSFFVALLAVIFLKLFL